MNRPRRWRAAALFATVAFAGCRQLLDVDDFSVAPVSAPTFIGDTDGYAYVSEGCRDCVDANCANEATDCEQDPACTVRAKCLAGCAQLDHDCRGGCNLGTPASERFSTLAACQAVHCGYDLPQEQRCGASLAIHGGAACDRCLTETQRCRDALDSLSTNASTLSYDQCRDTCSCQGECKSGAPGCNCVGEAGAEEALSLVTTCCPASCGQTDTDWSCLGHVESPSLPSLAPPLKLHLRVEKENFRTPIGNITVRACSELSVPSSDPGADCDLSDPAVTDDDGWTALSIQRPPIGDRYFGYLLLTSDDDAYSAPALFYFFPPIRQTPAYIVRRMVSRTLSDSVLAQVPGLDARWDKNGGIVWSALSCNRARQGVRIVSKSGLRVYYFDANLFVDPDLTETSTSGIGFIANVPPGKQELEARLPTGELVGKYTVSVVVGGLTHLVFNPTEESTALR